MTAEPLKPDRCPFCKSNYTDIFSQKFIVSNLPSGEASINHVECKSCRCHGPIGDTVDAAIAAWNRREPIGNPDELLPEWVKLIIERRISHLQESVNATDYDDNKYAWNFAIEELEDILSLKAGDE